VLTGNGGGHLPRKRRGREPLHVAGLTRESRPPKRVKHAGRALRNGLAGHKSVKALQDGRNAQARHAPQDPVLQAQLLAQQRVAGRTAHALNVPHAIPTHALVSLGATLILPIKQHKEGERTKQRARLR